MKNFLSLSAFVLVVSLLMTGCSKTSSQLFDAGSMTATAGGSAFNVSSCYENFVLSNTEDYYIKGTGTDGISFVVMRVRGSKLTPGDYYFDGTNSAWYTTNRATYYANGGTLTITSDTAGVATIGNFNFTTLHGTTVSGSFRAVFQH